MKSQAGRSMVEMLGVLAIIGVLSVGGIAGYRIAMEKYKINEVINAMNMVVIQSRDAIYNCKDGAINTMEINLGNKLKAEVTYEGYDDVNIFHISLETPSIQGTSENMKELATGMKNIFEDVFPQFNSYYIFINGNYLDFSGSSTDSSASWEGPINYINFWGTIPH